jgi:F1F0 ATPase subunit 2
MTSREAWAWALSLAGGGLLGVMYFGGLWWTVRRGVGSPSPGLWFSTSLFLRLSAAMAGFYLASRLGAGALLACALGFIAARMAVVRGTLKGRAPLKARHAA